MEKGTFARSCEVEGQQTTSNRPRRDTSSHDMTPGTRRVGRVADPDASSDVLDHEKHVAIYKIPGCRVNRHSRLGQLLLYYPLLQRTPACFARSNVQDTKTWPSPKGT